MNTQLNIKTRPRLSGSSFVTLLIGIVAVLAISGPSDQAQTTPAADAPVDSSITLVAKGALTDAAGNVTVQGNVPVLVRRVIDTTSVTSPSLVLLDLDFSQLTRTTGSGKNIKTFVTGGNHATEIRPLQASDTVIIPVPYYDSSKGGRAAK